MRRPESDTPLDRAAIARHFHALTAISREEVFGTAEGACRPLHLPADAATMFAGYVGRSYRHGQGLLLLGINPGGGGDADRYRTTEDEELYPLLADFKNAHSGGVVERFESANSCFARVVQRWNLWAIFQPTLAAAGRSIGDVAYMNVVPYRTRKNNTPPIAARRLAWARIVEPTIRLLAPQAIIALGKKAGAVVQPLNKTDVKYFCVPRTNGDRYVSEKALGVLAGIRESLAPA